MATFRRMSCPGRAAGCALAGTRHRHVQERHASGWAAWVPSAAKGWDRRPPVKRRGLFGNPGPTDGATLIYPQVEKVFAVKGPASGALAGRYVHAFTSKPAAYGLPNGDILLTTQRRGNPQKRRRPAGSDSGGLDTGGLLLLLGGGLAAAYLLTRSA